ncbi:putative ribonuclease H-like domain-containing protein [Tanacetum coccineum]|uniref:Ribonuclease H-like domain-containing protein n=1 Tax=Tanacetum coccineum TaxID=301880 RepID=A0ABQ5AYF7_9ASTR
MEFESAQSNTTAKLPILKLSEYEMWEIRIKQYFQNGTSVTKMSIPVTAEEKTNKKNDVKARSFYLWLFLMNINLLSVSSMMLKQCLLLFKHDLEGMKPPRKHRRQLAILGVIITPEDLNSKFLRSLPPEWNTHVVVWMNKADIETLSIDDLYYNFKIVKQDVKKSVSASTGTQNMAFITAPSTSSTNNVNTANFACEVGTSSSKVNTASSSVSTANISDNAVYTFMVENPNGSNLLQQELEQIHKYDMEAIDLKWQLSLLSMRAKRYYQRTGKKIFINANDTTGEPRNKEGQFRYQDNTRKQGNNEDTFSKTMLAIDGVGFDWSDMTEEQVKTNMALMAFSDSQNEVLYSEEVAVLKREVACKDYEIGVLKTEFEKVKQEKEGIDFKIAKFNNASKDLDNLLASQITNKSKKGLGYNVVAPPHPISLNAPTKHDLSYSCLDEFKEPEFNGQVSEDENSSVESPLNVDKETIFHAAKKINCPNHQKKRMVTGNYYNRVDYDYYAKTSHPTTHMNMTSRAVLLKSGLKPLSTARPGILQLNDARFVDSECSRHMTGNIGTLKTDNLDFKDLPDKSKILLKIPRKGNMYSFDVKNIVPKENLTCLVANATLDESILWHGRLGHINFKNMNKLVKENLVRGLPLKHFENDQTCVTCLKGKQHRASCKSKVLNPITKPLFMLYMDLFGPTFVSSLLHKKYCLVVTDDYSRFTWVLFLATKDETSEILKNFIKEIENLVNKNVKIIRYDNETEFKNKVMDDFCREKGIRREHSVARTPQQNGVAERRNRTLIEAARTMLADSKVLIVKPQNKTPYELFRGFKPALSFMKPFGCHVTILNTLDSLGKFDGKSDEGTSTNESVDASYFDSPSKEVDNDDEPKQVKDGPNNESDDKDKSEDDSSPKEVNAAGQHINTASPKINTGSFELNTVVTPVNIASSKDMLGAAHTFEATHVEFFSDEDEPEVDLGNILNSYAVPTTPNTRIHKDHPIKNVIGDEGPKRISKALSDPTWVEAIQEELLQFQKVWILIDLPKGHRAIGTKWIFRNKKDERGIVIRNKARLVAQGHTLEEGIDYDEVFSPVARIEAIRLFLAYASFMGFMVYQIDVKSAFLYGQIEEKQREDGKFIRQDKYVDEILRKFNYINVKSASTPDDLEKPLVKDGDGTDVDEHLYRSMIGSLMYLIASRPDIMFVVYACARFQVTPKTSHLLAVKRIFRYLKGKPTLGLWYSRDSPFELVAYTDSDYAGATQDRKSTTRGCQFLGNRLISWQCKKQTVVATSITEAEYVAAASCYGQIFLQKVLMLEDFSTWSQVLK